jgi:hypothetical protein
VQAAPARCVPRRETVERPCRRPRRDRTVGVWQPRRERSWSGSTDPPTAPPRCGGRPACPTCVGGQVVALFAWGYIPPGHAGDGQTFDAAYSAAAAAAELAAAIEDAVGAEATGRIERRVTYELPSKALLATATGADLLVIGARGAGGFRGLLLVLAAPDRISARGG